MKSQVSRYKQSGAGIDGSLREQLVTDYAPLVKFIAQRLISRLPPSIELDDLISVGVIGLMDAIEKYDASRENKFKTYAEFRISGAMMDELRVLDWVPRSIRNKAKLIERTQSALANKLGHEADELEVSTAMGMSLSAYQRLAAQAKFVSFLSLDDILGEDFIDRVYFDIHLDRPETSDPCVKLGLKYRRDVILRAMDSLPKKERLVLSLYYYESLNLKEIGSVLDVTESRVSQIHRRAINIMKKKLLRPDLKKS